MTFGRRKPEPNLEIGQGRKTHSRNLSTVAAACGVLIVMSAFALIYAQGRQVDPPNSSPKEGRKSPDKEPRPPADISILTRYPGVKVSYYEVVAANPTDARRYMKANGPFLKKHQIHVAAMASWNLNVPVPRAADGSCNLAGLDVIFSGEVILPRLSAVSAGAWSEKHLEEWDRFIEAVIKHEEGHLRTPYQGIARLRSAVRTASCETVNAIGNAEIQKLIDADNEYERRTNFGRNEGGNIGNVF